VLKERDRVRIQTGAIMSVFEEDTVCLYLDASFEWKEPLLFKRVYADSRCHQGRSLRIPIQWATLTFVIDCHYPSLLPPHISTALHRHSSLYSHNHHRISGHNVSRFRYVLYRAASRIQNSDLIYKLDSSAFATICVVVSHQERYMPTSQSFAMTSYLN
jgi:hypothetical protein